MGNPVDTPLRLNSADGQLAPHATRLRRAVALVIAIWAVGVIGHFTPLAEWPALFLYVPGVIGLTVFQCARADDWRGAFVTRHNLGAALA